jgi:chitin disaccharide deacetylase
MSVSKFLILLLAGATGFVQVYGQKTLAEKLGYPKDSKMLIIHADDVGLSHSEDSATIIALEKKGVNSASIMVPCPWFPEIAAYAKQHPELDWGIHLTLTSEWKNYKWGGVSSSNEIASLLDKDGYMYASVEDFSKNAKPADVEKEVKTQIEKAISFGIKLTHIDNHMGSILASAELATIYEKIGKQYGLPVLVPINYIRLVAPRMVNYLDTSNMAIVNNFGIAYPGIATDKWKGFYNNFIQNLKPGLNELIFHLAFDDDEFKAITIDHPDYGAAWRQRDFDYATSEEFKTLLKKDNIHVITWGDIKKVMYAQ